jgi:hypothetical protein
LPKAKNPRSERLQNYLKRSKSLALRLLKRRADAPEMFWGVKTALGSIKPRENQENH